MGIVPDIVVWPVGQRVEPLLGLGVAILKNPPAFMVFASHDDPVVIPPMGSDFQFIPAFGTADTLIFPYT